MPTYVYRCEECGYTFERFESINSEPVQVCPKCGAQARRLISAGAGLIFKGSGFYITDYKNKHSSGSPGKSGESKSTSTSSDKGSGTKE
ncbi:MAG: zinc ribbon domain-containing protein [Calditrichaeota bacterium]|jgi:putative FmdB family regulatory protein|nr:zinc ribbon domain-containing protein [Calditrichota bacterium]